MLQPILCGRPKAIQANTKLLPVNAKRAAQIAQLHDVPVVVRELTTVKRWKRRCWKTFSARICRRLKRAYHRLVLDFGYSAHDIAEGIGKSRPHVANMLRLLELPENVQ